jgi:UDPglucose 6-dehydrogenase
MNPEFLRAGGAVEDFLHPDRIVIGCDEKYGFDQVIPLYEGIDSAIIRTSLRVAEMSKYTSNAFLATKISFANDIGNLCKTLGIDVYEVMKCVGMDHRISPHYLNAGVGFGGSCIPKDVSALIHLMEKYGQEPRLLQAVMEVNENQPFRLVSLIEQRIGTLEGKRIAVLGLAFKDGTDDIRESKAIPVIAKLLGNGATVAAYDPMAATGMQDIFPNVHYCTSAAEALKNADACLILTEWPEFSKLNTEFEAMKSRIIIEGRKILSYDTKEKEGLCW